MEQNGNIYLDSPLAPFAPAGVVGRWRVARMGVRRGMNENHKKPNYLPEADWLQVMAEFLAGCTDAELAVRWNVSAQTIQNQRYKRGVYRRDVGRSRTVGGHSGAGSGAGTGSEAGAGGPGLAPPPVCAPLELEAGLDALTVGDRLFAHGLKLSAAGSANAAVMAFKQAKAAIQVGEARLRFVRASRSAAALEAANDDDETPAPPTLHPAQVPPTGAWRTWLFLGGRGAGKTLAGAAWLAGQARRVERLAIVGPTLGDVREVMIEGPSGLRGLAAGFGPEGGRPTYEPTRRRLLWPNGAVGLVFSAEDPDSLRGPQFHAAWADEFCAWTRPEATLAQLRLALRLGEDPRLMLSTTPRPTPALAALLQEPGGVSTRATTRANAENLAPGFVAGLEQLYGGSRLARQELEGEMLEAPEGALFRADELKQAAALGAAGAPERFDRLVVAVDPPAGTASGEAGAACGVVVAGLTLGAGGDRRTGTGWVLADRTAYGLSPGGWAARVAEAAAWAGRLGPVRVVAEANQGGEMVRQVLQNAGVEAPVRLVRASLSKAARAEPVALLYEQGRVAHAERFEALETQLMLLGAAGEEARRAASPDRADALVWALTALMLEPWPEGPRVRVV